MDDRYNLLRWDSDFFGYKVASIRHESISNADFEAVIEAMRREKVKLVYCFLKPGEDDLAELIIGNSGFLADTKITYFKPVLFDNDFSFNESVVSYDKSHCSPKLKELALQSGIYSRFKIDPNFRNNEFEKLYTEWVEKSVRREISDEVLVFTENNDEKGFVTISLKNGTGTIGLIAVDENERGRSIGKILMNSALRFMSENNAGIAEVATQQANEGACRFYNALGFKIKNIVNVYHLWIS
jgi:dTDP-4-amino-4,6-dideoxy-D-galactose acyltransferase